MRSSKWWQSIYFLAELQWKSKNSCNDDLHEEKRKKKHMQRFNWNCCILYKASASSTENLRNSTWCFTRNKGSAVITDWARLWKSIDRRVIAGRKHWKQRPKSCCHALKWSSAEHKALWVIWVDYTLVFKRLINTNERPERKTHSQHSLSSHRHDWVTLFTGLSLMSGELPDSSQAGMMMMVCWL